MFRLLFLLALPLLIVIAPIYIFCLRQLEKSDPELCWRVDQAYSDGLSLSEDHYVTNQFSGHGELEAGSRSAHDCDRRAQHC